MSDYIPVRLSHLLRHCSVGAIVRGPDYLMTVKDIREWKDRNGRVASRLIPYVDQVRSALGIEQELRKPPVAKELAKGRIEGACVPAMRFPSWMRCPTCGLLYNKPWRELQAGEKPRCRCEKRPFLEQLTWVVIHPDGYLADVPWHYLAHKDTGKQEQQQCRADWRTPYLYLTESNVSVRKIRCERCRATGELTNDLRIPYGNLRQQPWLNTAPGESTQIRSENDEPDLAVVIAINDARVHSAVTCNALVIPPESRIRKGTVVDRLYQSSQKRQRIDQARNVLARKGLFRSLASELHCLPEDIENAWNDIRNGYPLYGKETTPGKLLESEYRALLEELPDVADDEDFVTRHHTGVWDALKSDLPEHSRVRSVARSVDRLVAVPRLKEIQVFEGFQRNGGVLVPPDIVGRSDWLPAIELYGEGVFFTLEENILHRWEENQKLKRRALCLKKRYQQTVLSTSRSGQPDARVTPRFLLMHTLAHLLIRQLESQAGYPAASLRERIYCAVGKEPMSGILVYVAVPDIVGSLGGLAELAEPQRFLALLSVVFDHSEWCSLDPVCAEHEGQGPQLLNRAACHACALVPETSCAYGNVLLDRTFIKGDPADGISAFLHYVDSTG